MYQYITYYISIYLTFCNSLNYYNFELKELNRLAEFIIIFYNKKFIEINSSDNFKLENIYWNKYVHFGNVENFFPPEPYPYDSIQ